MTIGPALLVRRSADAERPAAIVTAGSADGGHFEVEALHKDRFSSDLSTPLKDFGPVCIGYDGALARA
ncbi:MAG: hypothetical protein LBK95_17955 [Bifidobacteriaceae bacterium]|nr:hypothetical protein [Bifidobacteriaceae bacterium]